MIPKAIRQVFVKAPFIFEMRKKSIKIEPDDLLLKIKACGICGTDYHIAKNGADDFTPIGHEISGVVEEIGNNVTRFKPGDTVVAENQTFCGVCDSCKNGQPIYCTNLKTYYLVAAGLADYIVLNHSMFNAFNGFNFEVATVAEPLTVALDVVKTAEIPLNSEVAIFGAGTIGLLCLQLIKMLGAKSILLIDNSIKEEQSKFRLETGKKLGADEIIGYNDSEFYEFIKSKYPNNFDRIIVTAPPQTLNGAIKIAKFGAILVLMGIVFDEKRIVSFDMNEFHFKRLQLRCTHGLPNLFFPLAIDLLKNNKIKANDLITHKFEFTDYKKAFDLLSDNRQKVIKVIVKM